MTFLDLPAPPPWFDQALCAGAGTDLWTAPDRELGKARDRREAAAVAICHTCPAMASCAEYGTAQGDPHHVWGGLTPEDRNRRTRRLRADQRVTDPKPSSVPKPIKHGTRGGYTAHRRRGEQACEECRAANARSKGDNQRRRQEKAT